MAATSPTTPKARTTFAPTTPATTRLNTSQHFQASPHYSTTKRHSLYGVEDRVIIDPGSRVWKVGFSGEGKPRDVFHPDGSNAKHLWNLHRATDALERADEDKLLEMRLQHCIRSVFHDSLLADPKARKVIVIESPLLPLYIKELMARILFENQVPSVSFVSSHILSLLAIGRITGLVVDCGHLEAVALPIFASRPLNLIPHMQSTPLAGSRLESHLRALLLMFGTYIPPPMSLSTMVPPASSRATRVPEEVLTDAVIEDIKTRCCFVGAALDVAREAPKAREAAPLAEEGEEEDIYASEAEIPPSSDPPLAESDGSELPTAGPPVGSDSASKPAEPMAPSLPSAPSESHLQALATMYQRYSSATDVQMKVAPPSSHPPGTGRGTLIIPGWIRERAAEVLFEGGDVDECSMAEIILNALLKVPRDLRKTMASSILITGGTAMMPGFIPRLYQEILRAISEPAPSQRAVTRSNKRGKRPPPPYDPYKSLRPLVPYFSILNNPSPPPPQSDRAAANSGKAPAFTPASLPWIGGSLSGALKTGGIEVSREKWDELHPKLDPDDSMDISIDLTVPSAASVLPDWTRTPLPPGAPPANKSGVTAG